MTLPEAMLFDVYTLANSKNEDEHADSSHFRIEWSYNRCLEEIVHDADGNPEYVLGVNWIFDHPHLYVSWGNRYIDGVAARFISLPLEK
jgi:hypothetical protein